MPTVRRASLLLVALLIPQGTTGGAPLDLRVTPPMTFEPAFVEVRVTVEASPDNRMLEVVVETPEFLQSSEIPLDGDRAPRVNTFAFRALPTGNYEVTSTLVGPMGVRARVARTLVVAPSRGEVKR
jgi:hypothetical protein